MENEKDVTKEELEAEHASLAEIKEDEIRESVISEYGFDETVDGKRIDKLVSKEVDSRKKLSKAIEQKIKYRTLATENKPTPSPVKTDDDKGGLSEKDRFALFRADVHYDDFEDVLDYAKLKKVSVAEAVNSSFIKSHLADQSEKRKSAEVANTGTTRKAPVKITDELLLEKASKGEVPEKGSEEAERLFYLRRGVKK